MKKIALLVVIFTLSLSLSYAANNEPQIDTLVVVDQVSISTIKQGLNLYRQPIASTIITAADIERQGVTEIKDVSQIVPNLHIPDYGSRTTSSIYIRGLGARIDQPVMGLNIDNVPYLNKNAFDTEVMEIERVEVLRGPQSTLYGRNTMGGVMNIYTLSPFNYQGIRAGAEYSSGNSYKLRASLYSKHSEHLATALSAYYTSSDGLFENQYDGKLCDWERSAGARFKIGYRASDRFRLENTASLALINQGGYPYMQLSTGEINYNDTASYDRITLSNGTTLKYHGDNYSLASITSYQYIDDDMFFDNDFTPLDYFTLRQAIKEHSVTEDIVYRSEHDSQYNFLIGAFGFFKHQRMNAPVTFKEYGIDTLILENANEYFGQYSFVWDEPQFVLGSLFSNQTLGGAIYHESTYESERWAISAGLRLDYERASLDYRNFADASCTVLDGNGQFYSTKPIKIDQSDATTIDFLEVLPKFNAIYRLGRFNQNSLYASIAKGYKAGGFNTQMFSDILQQRVMKEFGVSLGETYDTDEIISYKPEHSWNYEVGGHLENLQRTLTADLALFYIDCRDQQLTVFPEGQTTGRMMTNAGRSRSFGAEVAFTAQIWDRIRFNSSYGYTNAKFMEYVSGESNYAGNYVPYAPQHTLFAEMSYTQPIASGWLRSIGFDLNTSGVGKIYWSEDNEFAQPFYALLGSSIRFEMERCAISLWAKNILDKEYYTFYFMSMEREFVQCARPRTIGATLTINL
ncbi:MAG: TonB-dependent receptor plug domain-containing protein [Rikenellaceae bacterium]